jgi:hypothetical protein
VSFCNLRAERRLRDRTAFLFAGMGVVFAIVLSRGVVGDGSLCSRTWARGDDDDDESFMLRLNAV